MTPQEWPELRNEPIDPQALEVARALINDPAAIPLHRRWTSASRRPGAQGRGRPHCPDECAPDAPGRAAVHG